MYFRCASVQTQSCRRALRAAIQQDSMGKINAVLRRMQPPPVSMKLLSKPSKTSELQASSVHGIWKHNVMSGETTAPSCLLCALFFFFTSRSKAGNCKHELETGTGTNCTHRTLSWSLNTYKKLFTFGTIRVIN